MSDDRLPALASEYFQEYGHKIQTCVDRLTDDQLWWRPNEACNSTGNLLLHLAGNLSQWVLSSLGGRDYTRQRAAEFEARGGLGNADLLARFSEVVTDCATLAKGLSPSVLSARYQIQGEDTDGYGALLHAVEHMSYHTGQIVQISKELLGPEAGIEFYPDLRGP